MAFSFGAKKTAAPAPVPGAASVNPATAQNAETKQKQQKIFLLIGGAAALVGAYYVMSRDTPDKKVVVSSDGTETRIKVDDLGSRNLNEGEWIARSENDMARINLELNNLRQQQAGAEQVRKRVEQLEASNTALKVEGQKLFQAMSSENEKLRREVNTANSARTRETTAANQAAGNPDSIGTGRWRGEDPFRAGGPTSPGGARPVSGPVGMPEVKTLNFMATPNAKAGSRMAGFTAEAPNAGPTVIEAAPDFLPPNSYAPAKVIVGADER